MHFLKVGLLFATSTLSKLLAGLVVVKIIAVYIGAEGLGRLGQFMSLMSMVTILAGGGITTGIIKYVAEYKDDESEVKSYLAAASLVTVVSSFFVGAALFFGAPIISLWLIKTVEYSNVIRVLALAQFFIASANLLMGLLNGYRRVHAFAIINSLGVIIGAAGVALGCIFYGIRGAMYGLIWMPASILLLLLPWYRFKLKFEWRDLIPVWEQKKIRQFKNFSLMLIVTVVTMQMSQIIIRNIIVTRDSWVQVGYWQAVSRVSDAYLQFITVVLANYYLPRLSELKSDWEIRAEVNSVYKYAMPILLSMGIIIFLSRNYIIQILFSKDFLPMKDFFTWQLMGDGFKVAAYIACYVAVAKANMRLYIGAEIFQAGLLLCLSFLFIAKYGAIGATYAYFLCYLIYFLISFVALRMYFLKYKM